MEDSLAFIVKKKFHDNMSARPFCVSSWLLFPGHFFRVVAQKPLVFASMEFPVGDELGKND